MLLNMSVQIQAAHNTLKKAVVVSVSQTFGEREGTASTG